MSPFEDFPVKWEYEQQAKIPKTALETRRKVHSQPVAKTKPPKLVRPATSTRPVSNSRLNIPENPATLFVALSGRHVTWSYNPNKYIPRTVIGCPQNRIDSFCMGRDYRVIQKVFGEPNHATHDTWIFNGLKVKYLAGGGRHSVVHIGFLNGKVCRVTTDL